ncbi:amino acid permease [Siminovitchia terrae]|uniref:Amino acid permease n=1 Tax=Siminovitchia terrae TaxID=1914933 RepID=A0ABQ4KTH7_SIMTE|nr:APC family permease [Siminovitchia terrae]GIN91283.1 amino acid permease [Siminovitchia terrae]GIN94770.1 amino acid permease [Siminovitchia terrae]
MEKIKLARILTLSQVVILGIAWNNPAVFFNTYGIATVTSHGVITGAYILAFLAIFSTALSYAEMAKAYPIAGSAYTFAQKSMHPGVGFIVGWTIMLDYMLTPLVTALMSTIYLSVVLPGIPHFIWIILWTASIVIPSILGINISALMSKIFVITQIVFVSLFCILSIKSLLGGVGAGTLISSKPLFSPDVPIPIVLSGAAILCFSFLGFDSLTTLSEETVDPEKTIPRAIIIMLVIVGFLYITSSYLSQLVLPGFSFKHADSASLEIAAIIGGNFFKALFIAVMLMGNFTSGIAATTSASRVLFAMGRDSVLPKNVFGYVHPKFKTPSRAITVIALFTMIGIVLTLEQVIKFINFGALMAFTSVNLSVIAHYFIRNCKRSTLKDFVKYLCLPLTGASLTFWLWTNLETSALIIGGVWMVCGFVYLIYLTKLSNKKLSEIQFDQKATP